MIVLPLHGVEEGDRVEPLLWNVGHRYRFACSWHSCPLPRGYTEERWLEQRRAWDAIQHELLKPSTNSRLVIAENSIHNVQIEQLELVIQAVNRF